MSNIEVHENNITKLAFDVEPGQRIVKIGDKVFPVGVGGNFYPGSPVDISVVTATSEDVLEGRVIVTASGEAVTGNIQTVTAVSDGTTVTVPVGYIAVEQTFPVGSSGSDIDFTGVTVTADKLLNGVVAIDKDGNKVTGTIQNGVVHQDGAEITVFAGYYATDQLIELPVLDTESIHINGSDVVIPPGYNPEESYFVLHSADINVDGGYVYISGGYVSEDRELVIDRSEITETATTVRITAGYLDEELNYNIGTGTGTGTGGSAVKYGYVNADGLFQELDLTGDNPTDSADSPVALSNTGIYMTGKSEPEYAQSSTNPSEPDVEIPTDGLVFYPPLKENKGVAETGQSIESIGSVVFTGDNMVVIDESCVCTSTDESFAVGSHGTISLLCRPFVVGTTHQCIMTVGFDDADGTAFNIYIRPGGVFVGVGGGETNVYANIVAGKLYHLTAVANGERLLFYVNGEKVSDKEYSVNCSGDLISVGAFADYANEPYTGSVSEVRLYNRSLTTEEVVQTNNALLKTAK